MGKRRRHVLGRTGPKSRSQRRRWGEKVCPRESRAKQKGSEEETGVGKRRKCVLERAGLCSKIERRRQV